MQFNKELTINFINSLTNYLKDINGSIPDNNAYKEIKKLIPKPIDED